MVAPAASATLGDVGVGVLPGVAVGVLEPEVEYCELSLGGGVSFPVRETEEAEAGDMGLCVDPGRATLGGMGGAPGTPPLPSLAPRGGNMGGTF